jgi:hypothetical protein
MTEASQIRVCRHHVSKHLAAMIPLRQESVHPRIRLVQLPFHFPSRAQTAPNESLACPNHFGGEQIAHRAGSHLRTGSSIYNSLREILVDLN